MNYYFQSTVRSARPSIIREFANRTAQIEDAINLTLGEPDFNTPERIKQAGIKAIQDNHTRYTNNDGLRELRVAACDYFKRHYGLTYDPDWEMMVTHGSTEGLDVAFRTLLSSGDDVIIPAPVYPGYAPLIRFCGASPLFVDTSSNHFILTPDMLDKIYTPYTKCIVIPYPCNPTGAVPTREELMAIVEWLLEHPDVFVVSDEIYAGLSYGKEHISIASLNRDIWERTVVLNGLSKSHAMTGWRIGFLAAPIKISDELYKVHQAIVTCAASISQYAAIEAVKDDKDTEIMKKAYSDRCDYFSNELRNMGFELDKPDGAFYVFPSIKKYGMSSTEFSNMLLDRCHIGTVPGNAFSSFGGGYIRMSIASSMDDLERCVQRMKPVMEELNSRVNER